MKFFMHNGRKKQKKSLIEHLFPSPTEKKAIGNNQKK